MARLNGQGEAPVDAEIAQLDRERAQRQVRESLGFRETPASESSAEEKELFDVTGEIGEAKKALAAIEKEAEAAKPMRSSGTETRLSDARERLTALRARRQTLMSMERGKQLMRETLGGGS